TLQGEAAAGSHRRKCYQGVVRRDRQVGDHRGRPGQDDLGGVGDDGGVVEPEPAGNVVGAVGQDPATEVGERHGGDRQGAVRGDVEGAGGGVGEGGAAGGLGDGQVAAGDVESAGVGRNAAGAEGGVGRDGNGPAVVQPGGQGTVAACGA